MGGPAETSDSGAADTTLGDLSSEPAPASTPLPEESITQPWRDARSVGGARQAELRGAYGYVRAAIKARPDRFQAHQLRLKQARIPGTYDMHLARTARLAAAAAMVGLVAGLVVTAAIAATGGSFDPIRALYGVPGTSFGIFETSPAIASGAVLATAGGMVAGSGVLVYRTYYPRYVIRARRRSINQNLPYAIMFMYALSRGGMNFLDVCRRLADAEGMYGEVATEFDMVIREIDLFGNDLLQALNNVQALTPSEELQRFLDDLLSVLESGGDLETFLQSETEKSLDTAHEDQETLIETIGTLSELFVVAFVAAPLLLIVVLMVVSFLGAETVQLIEALVYVIFPLGMAGFLLVVDLLSGSTTVPTSRDDTERDRRVYPDEVADDPRFATYRRARTNIGLRATLVEQVRAVRHQPRRSLWLSVPAALVVGGIVVFGNVASPTVEAFVVMPVWTTGWLVVGPLLTATVPLMVLHERERRRSRVVAQRLPDVLTILSNANEMGVDLVDGCELVTRWSSGVLADEFGKVRNDLMWNHDIRRALLSFADRMSVPQLTRSMTLIAEGSHTSGDLHSLLDIAAADTRARVKLDRARRRNVNSYVTIVIIGFLVYLLVIVMVSSSYLDPIAELSAGAPAPDRPAALAGIGAVPVDAYRLLFLHSALIQGVGSGLIAGKLADNNVTSGLKYGIAMVLTTLVAFVLFV